MPRAILAINAGSSSIKFAAYAIGGSELTLVCRGLLDHHAGDTQFVIKNPVGEILQNAKSVKTDSRRDLATSLLDRIEPLLDGNKLAVVGHRIVHGGPDFSAPVTVDAHILQALDALTPLAPLHQPGCLAPIRSLQAARPGLLQVACFDTAFHRDLAPIYRRFPLPPTFEAKGIRRYGFHGLSFEYVVRHLNRPQSRMVVAHLGSGTSLCAIREGKSINTTMSLTPLDGDDGDEKRRHRSRDGALPFTIGKDVRIRRGGSALSQIRSASRIRHFLRHENADCQQRPPHARCHRSVMRSRGRADRCDDNQRQRHRYSGVHRRCR
jgi:acetate kinase